MTLISFDWLSFNNNLIIVLIVGVTVCLVNDVGDSSSDLVFVCLLLLINIRHAGESTSNRTII